MIDLLPQKKLGAETRALSVLTEQRFTPKPNAGERPKTNPHCAETHQPLSTESQQYLENR